MGGDARANQQHLWETLAATKLLGMVGAPPINLLSIGIGDNVGKTIIHHPFGNGKHTTYENCDFWDDLLGLPHKNDGLYMGKAKCGPTFLTWTSW